MFIKKHVSINPNEVQITINGDIAKDIDVNDICCIKTVEAIIDRMYIIREWFVGYLYVNDIDYDGDISIPPDVWIRLKEECQSVLENPEMFNEYFHIPDYPKDWYDDKKSIEEIRTMYEILNTFTLDKDRIYYEIYLEN